jgi:hypothetical protein
LLSSSSLLLWSSLSSSPTTPYLHDMFDWCVHSSSLVVSSPWSPPAPPLRVVC